MEHYFAQKEETSNAQTMVKVLRLQTLGQNTDFHGKNIWDLQHGHLFKGYKMYFDVDHSDQRSLNTVGHSDQRSRRTVGHSDQRVIYSEKYKLFELISLCQDLHKKSIINIVTIYVTPLEIPLLKLPGTIQSVLAFTNIKSEWTTLYHDALSKFNIYLHRYSEDGRILCSSGYHLPELINLFLKLEQERWIKIDDIYLDPEMNLIDQAKSTIIDPNMPKTQWQEYRTNKSETQVEKEFITNLNKIKKKSILEELTKLGIKEKVEEGRCLWCQVGPLESCAVECGHALFCIHCLKQYKNSSIANFCPHPECLSKEELNDKVEFEIWES